MATPSNRDQAPDLARQTAENLEFDTVLKCFACEAQTLEGKALVMSMGLLPAADQQPHFKQLACWFEYLKTAAPLRFPAIPAAQTFAVNPNLEPFDREALRTLRDLLKAWLSFLGDKALAFATDGFSADPDLEALTRRLGGLFQPDGHWRDDVSPLYKRLIQDWFSVERSISQSLARLLKSNAAHLNETVVFERNRRKVLAVKLAFKGRVRGILHDYSSSGNTVFIEPEETVGSQNRLTQIQAEMEEELWRIRCEMTAAILAVPSIYQGICPRLAHMDRMQALSLTGKRTDAQCITPNGAHRLILLDARHPFLDAAFAYYRQRLANREEADENIMVPFSLSLEEPLRGLIVSGANTGGKTVTLKTTGLLAWMANCGLPVPLSEGSAIPFYHTILADIGDHQSLSHNLSTFASHLANMSQVLKVHDPDTLVLLDELGSGTDPQEGNALGQAMIEEMIQRGFHLLVTTHQQVLCTFAMTHPHLENGSMAFDTRRLMPLYRFHQGVPGRSHALEIAGAAGLPGPLLARAGELVDGGQVDIQAAIRVLQQQSLELQKQKKKLRQEELRLHHRKKAAREQAAELERSQAQFKEKSKVRVGKAVDRAERELRTLLTEVESQKQRRQAVTKFAKLRQSLEAPFETPEKEQDLPVNPSGLAASRWKAGDRVYYQAFRREGILVSLQNKRARVNCDGKVLTLPVGELIHLEPDPDQATKTTVIDHEPTDDGAVSTELRLLGYRVEEALSSLDQTIDQALRRGLPFLRIIHGHGSGALKAAVRRFLGEHLAKHRFSVAIDQKNDGVTELRFEG